MSSTDEDDYMSDKLLPPPSDTSSDVRPGLLYSRALKRRHELQKKQEQERHERSKVARGMRESALREEGLNTAIAPENKGFQMLSRMGYVPGTSLGRSQEAIVEPIPINVKVGKSGIGKKERAVEMKERTKLELERREREFREANYEKTVMVQIRRDFFKAQRICEELDFREGIKEPQDDCFWTWESIRKLRRAGEEVESSDEEDIPYDLINNENLCRILNYLRSTHFYCLYCVFKAESSNDLIENCPGPYREDHDDD